uniref:Uncharacterized protein n=1 Tax=Siphoviridae sp. ctoic9 TaxID=2825671 RepID=A0A8S5Q9V9_9CAUD|nr:MAG TPA: hypothetical protein [Siphoviridae sp. ctoic9]
MSMIAQGEGLALGGAQPLALQVVVYCRASESVFYS